MIESVLGELVSKDLLYEPFMCMKTKVKELLNLAILKI